MQNLLPSDRFIINCRFHAEVPTSSRYYFLNFSTFGGKNILKYHNSITHSNGLIISIDNIVFDCIISLPSDREALMRFIDRVFEDAEVFHWQSGKIGTFRENFRFALRDGSSFWLGFVLNGKRPEWGRVRLDFNPNKTAWNKTLQSLFFFLCCASKEINRKIKRFDLAIDIPVNRYDCFLVKDNRAYIERKHGQEWTQYLGAKSSHTGRVKLYNKQIEAKLPYELTRLELTLSPDTLYEQINFPTVFYIKSTQLHINEVHLTDTERFILNALLQGFGSTKDLGRKTRAKVESVLDCYVEHVSLSQEDYKEILSLLNEYTSTGIIYKE